jgi:hypothetical protein
MLLPMIQASQLVCGQDTLIAADAGYHSKENLQALAELNVEALIADNQMRQRDERLAGQAKHKAKGDPLHDKRRVGQANRLGLYRPQEFTVSRDASHCICPAGQRLYSNGNRCTIKGRTYHKYTGTQKACVPCVASRSSRNARSAESVRSRLTQGRILDVNLAVVMRTHR